MTAPVHRVLLRQIKKARGADGRLDIAALLASVHDTYGEHERDLKRINRANRLMAEELEEMMALRDQAAAAEVARKAADAESAAKTHLLTTMSHELRTPLNAIIGYSELIREELTEGAHPDTIDEDAARILHAAKHLLHLINDVLDFAKYEARGVEISVAEFDLAVLMRDLKDVMRPAALENGVELVFEAAEGLAFSDAFRLKQCLLNLLSNGVKFSSGGKVTLRAHWLRPAGERRLQFDVIDTGVGMTPDELHRAFTPFEQANSSWSRQYGGTGLGLAITTKLAHALGGGVSAHSVKGEGSTFTLTVAADMRAQAGAKRVATVS